MTRRFERLTDSELKELKKGLESNSRVAEWWTADGRKLYEEITAEQARRACTRFSAFGSEETGGMEHALELWLKEIHAASLVAPCDEPICKGLLEELKEEDERRAKALGGSY